MKSVGFFLVILGAGSFVLPLINMNVRGFDMIPVNARPFVGGGLIAVGAILAFLGRKGKKQEKK